jgi:transposase InsO family protein
LRQAFPFDQLPRYLLRDRDTIFGNDFRDQVRDLGIREVLSAPRSPWQRAYVGRVIGSIRRECLVFPSLLKQDPRYFYKGTGSTGSKIVRAVGNSVVCKGDDGRWQMNYSNIAGIFGGAAASSTYYPARNQGAVILSNSLIRLGESSLAGIFQEFIFRKLTKPPKGQVLSGSQSTQVPSIPSNPTLTPNKP